MAETLRTLDEELVTRTEVDSSGLTGALVPVLLAGLLCTTPIADLGSALAGSFVEDAIVNGVTTKAPSQNAVYDALALKADSSALSSYLTSSTAAATYLTIAGGIAGYQPLDADLTSWSAVARASGFDAWTASPSSSNLGSLLTDKTGTGVSVFATSPTLVTPVLGVASATSINKVAFTAPATGSTLTIADGKTLTASNTLTFTGTDGTTFNVDNAVIGPASSVAGRIATFSGTSGKVIQDSGYTINQSLATTNSPTFAGLTISHTTPAFVMYESGAATDEKNWRLLTTGGNLYIGGFNDAATVGFSPIIITRTGTTADSIDLIATALTFNTSHVMTRGATETITGVKTFNGAGQRMTFTGAATAASYLDFVNTTGRLIIGVDSSTGGNFFAGSSAYASIISSQANTALIFATNSLPRMTISAAGTVTVGGAFASDSVQVVNALGITFARPTFAQWQMVHGTANTMAGWGVLQATAGLYAMWIASSTQYVGIGTVDPTARLHVEGTVRFSSFGAGTLVTDSSGNVTASSDADLKTILRPFTRGLTALRLIDAPVVYKWNELSGLDQTCEYAGFTAQGVYKGIPEAIGIGQNGMLTLQERPILAAHHNAILELEDRISALQEEVNELKLAA